MAVNLLNLIPAEQSEELFTVLAEGEGVKIERIVSDGQASPEGFWYDQKQNEWVLLISGCAVLSVETDTGIEQIKLNPGDYQLIPARQRHRVESTSLTGKTIWLAVYYEDYTI